MGRLLAWVTNNIGRHDGTPMSDAGAVPPINARLRDELLDGEIFYSLREAQVVIESWRRHYNHVRPHASLGYRAPAPEVIVPAFSASFWLDAPVTLGVASRPVVH
jgi:transposase InsO family protein